MEISNIQIQIRLRLKIANSIENPLPPKIFALTTLIFINCIHQNKSESEIFIMSPTSP